MSPYIARDFFWDEVDSFSMNFAALCTSEGERLVVDFSQLVMLTRYQTFRFRKEVQAAGKKVASVKYILGCSMC
jgi:hypothetical protein